MIINNSYDQKAVIRKVGGLDLTIQWEVLIHKAKTKRSVQQNALYWAWITVIQIETGNDKDDLHEYFKTKFLIDQVVTVFGQPITKKATSTKLNTKQFTEYLEQIKAFSATELQIELLTPDDKRFSEFISSYGIILNNY